MDVLNATINLTANENITKNGTTSGVQDPQGLVIAYFSLFIMAIVPIYIGAQKSVSRLKDQKKSGDNSVETLTNNDAAMFPLYASAGLFGLYLFFKIFSKEYINMLLSTYFFVLGVLALSNTLNPLIEKYLPDFFPNCLYKLEIKKFSIPPPNEVIESSPEKTVSKSTENSNNKSKSKKDKSDKKQSNDNVEVNGELKNLEKTNENKTQLFECLLDYPYKRKEFIGLFISAAVGVWYMLTKHWIANNLFGLAFSVSAVELMHLNKVVTGCILLGGLFIYDIFWVFGTNVMVTVAKSFEAPIKLVFPRDLVMSGFSSTNYAMLGLGDIVIPGIFVALLLRFDYSQKKGKQTYFIAGYVAYIIGLMTTMLVMHVFKHAQPALLYLVPACLGIPIILSVILGDQAQLFKYEDNPKVEESKSS